MPKLLKSKKGKEVVNLSLSKYSLKKEESKEKETFSGIRNKM